MTDEEKKAVDRINKLVKYLRKSNENVTIVPEDIKYFEKILDMIKTYIRMIDENIEEILEQSKEIEELNKSDESKEQSSMKYYNLYRELVDKIKAKIEEYKKDGKIINQTMPYCGEYKNHFEIKALQSLLEKE